MTFSRSTLGLLVGAALAILGLPLVTGASSAGAAAPRFANCTAMHQNHAYIGGIARVGAKDKRSSGKARYKPYVSSAFYNANIKMDADHDGIACEQ